MLQTTVNDIQDYIQCPQYCELIIKDCSFLILGLFVHRMYFGIQKMKMVMISIRIFEKNF